MPFGRTAQLQTVEQDEAIVGTLKPVLARCVIGGAIIPSLRGRHVREMQQHYRLGYTGMVSGKRVDEQGCHMVDLSLWITNQRDERTTIGSAVIELPTRAAAVVS